MQSHKLPCRRLLLWSRCWPVLLATILPSGCSRDSSNRYTPNSDIARRAVETALTAWQQGKPIGTFEVDGVKVDVDEFEWRGGKKLDSFEITEDISPGEGPKQFRVQLKTKGARAPAAVSYFVYGIDPLSVSRDKDYERLKEM